MNNTLRLLIVCSLAAFAFAVFLLGIARHSDALQGPFNLILFCVGIAVYFLPTMLAMYRDCHATPFIALINVLLGWTILGWFAALGWAATGRTDTAPPMISTPPKRPVTGH
jgi:hypothetical protein